MALVFQKTKVNRNFQEMNNLIYGFPKSGKTTICSELKLEVKDEKGTVIKVKEPLFISTEKGNGELEYYNVMVEQKMDASGNIVSIWETFKRVKDYIVKNQDEIKENHSCIVIDLITDLDAACSNYICNKFKVADLQDLAYGKGTNLQSKEFTSAILELFSVLPVTFIAHTSEKEIMINGEKIKTQAPSMSKKGLEFISGKCDNIGFIIPSMKTKETPTLSFNPSVTAICGSRNKSLAKQEIPLKIGKTNESLELIRKILETK